MEVEDSSPPRRSARTRNVLRDRTNQADAPSKAKKNITSHKQAQVSKTNPNAPKNGVRSGRVKTNGDAKTAAQAMDIDQESDAESASSQSLAEIDSDVQASEDETASTDNSADEDFDDSTRRNKKAAKGAKARNGASQPKKNVTSRRRLVKAAANSATKGARKIAAPRQNASGSAQDMKILPDSGLYAVVASTDLSIDEAVAEWIKLYQESEAGERKATGQFVTFVLRLCGSNTAIDDDQALDLDGIVAFLQEAENEYKRESSANYPIISKSLGKSLRTRLRIFAQSLVSLCHDSDLAYSTDIYMMMQAWVTSLTSSNVRAFRHTATFLAMLQIGALASKLKEISETTQLLTQQKTVVEKKGRSDTSAVKDIQKQIQAQQRHKTKCDKLIKSYFDAVFINRFRDLDAGIRNECVVELGSWMLVNADKFVSLDYMRYVGWMLSDMHNANRLAAIQIINNLYAREGMINRLTGFNERFKSRLVEMASGDIDTSVRVAALQPLITLSQSGFLGETSAESISHLVLDADARVRKAVGPFLAGQIKDKVQTILDGSSAGSRNTIAQNNLMEKRVQLKVLTTYLGQLISSESGDIEEQLNTSNETSSPDLKTLKQKTELSAVLDSLWDALPVVSEYALISTYLALDHTDAKTVNKEIKLSEEQESLLLELLSVSLHKQHDISRAVEQKTGKENANDELTNHLMERLPNLITKYQSTPPQLSLLINLVELMSLELYMDTRDDAGLRALWDVIKHHFTTHNTRFVLTACASAVGNFVKRSQLSDVMHDSYQELDQVLVQDLRINCAKSNIDSCKLTIDQVRRLELSISRVGLYVAKRNITQLVSAQLGTNLHMVCARSRLNNETEAALVKECLDLRLLSFLWLAGAYLAAPDQTTRAPLTPQFKEARDDLWESTLPFATGTTKTVSTVREAAFDVCLQLIALSFRASQLGQIQPLALTQSQQLNLNMYMADLLEKRSRAGPKIYNEEVKSITKVSPDDLKLVTTLSRYMLATQLKGISLDLCASLLSYYSRVSGVVDSALRLLLDHVKDVAVYGKEYTRAMDLIYSSIKLSFDNYGRTRKEEDLNAFVELCKALSNALFVRGSQLKVVAAVPSGEVCKVHLRALDFWMPSIEDRELNRDIFKGLLVLLGVGSVSLVQSEDALFIYSKLEELLKVADLSIASDSFESLRNYQKRLNALVIRDRGARQAKVRQQREEEAAEVDELDPDAALPPSRTKNARSLVESDHDDSAAPTQAAKRRRTTEMSTRSTRSVGTSNQDDVSIGDLTFGLGDDDDSVLGDLVQQGREQLQ